MVQDNVIDELIPIHLFVQKWLSDYQAEDLYERKRFYDILTFFFLQDPDKDGDKPRMQTYDVDLNT